MKREVQQSLKKKNVFTLFDDTLAENNSQPKTIFSTQKIPVFVIITVEPAVRIISRQDAPVKAGVDVARRLHGVAVGHLSPVLSFRPPTQQEE